MRYLALAVLGIALFFAACSGSDDPQQQADAPAPAAAQQSQSGESTAAASPSSARQEQAEPEPQTAAARQRQESERDQQSAANGSVEEPQNDQETPAERQSQAAGGNESEQSQAGDDQTESESTQAEAEDQPAQSEEAQAEMEQEQAEPSEPAQQQQEQQQAQPMQPEDEEELQEQQQAEPDDRPSESERLRLRAEAIAADATVTDFVGIVRWLNGDETTIALELAKGNVVLIDFWTYTCINCIRTLPFLTEWHDKYADRGLVIIGVHTPEFDFERDPGNVQAAIDQYGVQYRVPQDNDYKTWRAFKNRFWPAKYLIGPTMDVRYKHFGEGDYEETEIAIREALQDAGHDVSDIPFGTAAVEPQKDPDRGRQTRELYGGTRRNYNTAYAAQPEYYLQAGVDIFYEDIDTSREQREHHKWYLQGLWRNDREAIVHARVTENLEDYLAFEFRARTVNVVLTVAEDGDPFNVYIEMDGRWLRPDEAGDHIRWDDEGRSYIRVTVNDLYRLVKLDTWSRHELKLRSNSDQLQIFAFTFGSYLGGE